MGSLSEEAGQDLRHWARRQVADATGATDLAAQDRVIAQALELAAHSYYSFQDALRCILGPYYEARRQSQIATGDKLAHFANVSPMDRPGRDPVRWIVQHPARTPLERIGIGTRPGAARAKARRRAARKAAAQSRRMQHR